MSSGLFDLTGRTALVTGSSSGIGYALARGLAQAGAQVVLNGREDTRLREGAGRLAGEGLTVHVARFDVTDEDLVNDAVSEIEPRSPRSTSLSTTPASSCGCRFRTSPSLTGAG